MCWTTAQIWQNGPQVPLRSSHGFSGPTVHLMVQSPETGPGNDTLGELHRIWESATAESISGDLDRAAGLAENVSDLHREEAARYMAALWRLERWLHDR